MIDFVRVGNKIFECRRNLNMTQDELSEKLFVTRQALSKWENGTGVPSINTILDLCKIFKISFEELLCLDEEIEIDPNNIFKGHDRKYVMDKLCKGEIDVELSDIFYLLSPSERMILLKAIKDGKVICDLTSLYVKLTISEQKYLNDYIINRRLN